jgi:hypothetical protein
MATVLFFKRSNVRYYGFFVGAGEAVVFAGFTAFVLVVAEWFAFDVVLLTVVFDTIGVAVLTGAGVAVFTMAVLFAGLLTLTLVLVAASPQAMPRALMPRTAESAITFFICLQTPDLSQRYIFISSHRPIKHGRFCHELFHFQGKRKYSNLPYISQPKKQEKWMFL